MNLNIARRYSDIDIVFYMVWSRVIYMYNLPQYSIMAYANIGWKGAALLEAKLHRTIIDPILGRFKAMYQEALDDTSSSYNKLQRFQLKLQEIKTWTGDKAQEEYESLFGGQNIVPSLLRSIFYCSIKEVLNELGNGASAIPNYNMPKAKSFVHKVYLEAAKRIYRHPHYMTCCPDKVRIFIKKAVSDAIKDMLPFDQMLGGQEPLHIQEGQIDDSIQALMDQIELDGPMPGPMPGPPMQMQMEMENPMMPGPGQMQIQMENPMMPMANAPLVVPAGPVANNEDILNELDPLSNIDLPAPDPAGNILQVPNM